jgi:hypothetical protein
MASTLVPSSAPSFVDQVHLVEKREARFELHQEVHIAGWCGIAASD